MRPPWGQGATAARRREERSRPGSTTTRSGSLDHDPSNASRLGATADPHRTQCIAGALRLGDDQTGGSGTHLAEIGVEADVALRFGRGRYRGLKSVRIGDDEVFPVCSPSFLKAHPAAADFGVPTRRKVWGLLPRLVDSVTDADGSGCDWGTWGKSVGLNWGDEDPTIVFSQGHLALQAAAEGMGVALARRVLAADDLASGRLVRAGNDPPLPSRFGYYFVTRTDPDARSRSLAAWLKTQLAKSFGLDCG